VDTTEEDCNEGVGTSGGGIEFMVLTAVAEIN